MLSLMQGNLDIIKMLFNNHQFDLKIKDKNGFTILDYAVMANNYGVFFQVIKMIIDKYKFNNFD